MGDLEPVGLELSGIGGGGEVDEEETQEEEEKGGEGRRRETKQPQPGKWGIIVFLHTHHTAAAQRQDNSQLIFVQLR